MKIIILGYSGLIGKNILKYLSKNTFFELVCVGRDAHSKPIVNQRIKYIKWDFKSFTNSNLSFLKKTNIVINCVGKIENKKNIESINFFFIKKLIHYINSQKLKIRFIHLSSVSVYGGPAYYFGQHKIIYENNPLKSTDLYSRSKIKGDLIIQGAVKKNLNKNFSYTILRISNVFGGKKKTNLFKFVFLTIKMGIWIKCSNDIVFNFVNLRDVTQAIILTIVKPKISKNKIYIVSDDCKQIHFYQNCQRFFNKKIINIRFPISLIKLLINIFPIPKKILNFFLIISSKVNYSNKKIKKELGFKPNFSIIKSQVINE